jgi:excisionase family DNA binding protein
MPDPGKLLYSTAEACELLNVGKSKLFELLRSGELNSTRIGSARLIAAQDLSEFVTRLRTAAPAAADRARQLVDLIDESGRIDVAKIPAGTTLTDLEVAKRLLADRQAVA